MFSGNYDIFYIATIALQIICAIHSVRRGTQQKWIWLIIFIPLAGSLIYLFSEVFTRSDLRQVKSGVGAVINPSGRIKKLEANLRFSDTFQNRMLLADACLEAGQLERAVAIYEESLQGHFAENEHALSQLVIAYARTGHFEKAVAAGKKLQKLPQFARSAAHIALAQSLAELNRPVEAEAEFKKMSGKYANFEARYLYGRFLQKQQRTQEAVDLWNQMTAEAGHLSGIEKRHSKQWIAAARLALKRPEPA